MENLGKLGKDKVTGFEGIITAKATHLYGCDSYFIVPKVKDGKIEEAHWFDVGRIEIIGEGVTAQEVQTEKPGGENLSSADNRVI
jgi:hypothetical protein